MSLTPVFTVGPEAGAGYVAGYIDIPSAQMLIAKIDFGFKANIVDLIFSVPDSTTVQPYFFRAIRGLGLFMTTNNAGAVTQRFLAPGNGIYALSGDFHDWTFSDVIGQDGGYGWWFGESGSAAGTMFTKVSFIAWR